MKRLLLLTQLILSIISANAQNFDGRIARLINEEDWLELNRVYSIANKDSVNPTLGLIAETMQNRVFNRPFESVKNMEELLSNHQNELGSQTLTFAKLRAVVLGEANEYGKAADAAKKLIDQLKGKVSDDVLKPIEQIYYFYKPIAQYGKPTVTRPNRDVTVRFQTLTPQKNKLGLKKGKKAFKSFLITVHVRHNGKTYRMVLDTGAEKSMFTTEFAKDAGLKTFMDSISVNGKKAGVRTFIDNLEIGDITCHNIIGTVVESNDLSNLGVNAVLGLDVMNALGEVQIDYDSRNIIFPIALTASPSTGRNMILDGGKLFFEAYCDKERLLLNLDTGNGSANLSPIYFKKHQQEVENKAEIDTVSFVGAVATDTSKKYLMHNFNIMVQDKPVHFDEIYVQLENNGIPCEKDGNMGMEMICQFKKTIINLKDMFVVFE